MPLSLECGACTGASDAAEALHHQTLPLLRDWNQAAIGEQPGMREVAGPLEMSGIELITPADVENLGNISCFECLVQGFGTDLPDRGQGFLRLGAPPGLEGLEAAPGGQSVQADPDQSSLYTFQVSRLADQCKFLFRKDIRTNRGRKECAGLRPDRSGQVTRCEVCPGPEVNDLTASRRKFLWRNSFRIGQLPEPGHPIPVLLLHASEVEGWGRLPGQHVRDEGILLLTELEGLVETSFVPDRRLWDRAKGLPAGTACSMGRQDLHEVRKFEEGTGTLAEIPSCCLHHAFDTRCGLEQIRSTQIPDEDEVPTQECHGFIRASTQIGDQVAHVLGCVAGGVQDGELDATDPEGVPTTVFDMVMVCEPS